MATVATTAPKIQKNQSVPPARRGGARPGAGRKPGRPDRATADEKDSLERLAKQHAPAALKALVEIATKGESEAARVTAALGLLDRGYGRPRQAVEHTGEGGGPLAVVVTHRIVDPVRTRPPSAH